MHIKLSFHIKLFLCLVAFSCVLLTLIGVYTYYKLDAQLHRDLGARAQVQAREIALIPSLITAVENNDTQYIAALMKKSVPAAMPAILSSAIATPCTFTIPNMPTVWEPLWWGR